MKQERQLTADAVLARAAVVQDQDPEFLGVVKDLQWYGILTKYHINILIDRVNLVGLI